MVAPWLASGWRTAGTAQPPASREGRPALSEPRAGELARCDVEVVIPLRWPREQDIDRVEEMTAYLERLSAVAAFVTVVDGSDAEVRHEHERRWSPFARVVVPDAAPGPGPRNGKVVGAVTGIRCARSESVLLADDDVRLTARTVRQLVARLAGHDLVRPVNVFDEWPWHARWDGARTLLNLALGFDWPGVFALRRSAVLACGGWSELALFENLELWRTMVAAGARVRTAADVVVARRPPDSRHFWSQRVRQAYDDLAQPVRLVCELSLLPGLVALARRSPAAVLLVAVAAVAVAEVGRGRLARPVDDAASDAGSPSVPATVAWFAPVWLLERGVCAWLAVAQWCRGGALYHGQRMRLAAHSPRWLQRHLRHGQYADAEGGRRGIQ